MFLVLKLSKEITYTDYTGNEQSVKLNGVAGFCPVFATLEEAKESSQNGKYEIVQIAEKTEDE